MTANIDWIELYQKYLPNQLRRAGSQYKTNCPFHDDRTPSFTVDPIKGVFHCLGCEAGGTYKKFLLMLKEEGIMNDDEYNTADKEFDKLYNEYKNNSPTPDNEIDTIPAEEPANAFLDVKQGYEKLGYTMTTYEYRNLNNELVYKWHRFEKEGEKKLIPENLEGKTTLGNIKRIPYGLEQFKTITNPKAIWLVEGEKCKDRTIKGIEYITGYNERRQDLKDIVVLSFRKPNDLEDYKELFKNKDIVIFEDNDDKGKRNTKGIIDLLQGTAKTIKVVNIAEAMGYPDKKGYDIADFLEEEETTIYNVEMLIEQANNNPLIEDQPLEDIPDLGIAYLDIPELDTPLTLHKGTIDKDKLDITDNFVLEPFIPAQAITLLDGAGELGKSILAMQLGLCIATGKEFLDTYKLKTPNKVIYITAEETPYNFNDRLEKLINSLNPDQNLAKENFFWISTLETNEYNTHNLLEPNRTNYNTTDFYNDLEGTIQKIKPKLMVLDSLINFYGLDENTSKDAIEFMNRLKYLCSNYDMAILVIHHQTKENNNTYRGSGVFREQARARITIKMPDNENDKTKRAIRTIEIEKLNYYSKLREQANNTKIKLISNEKELYFKATPKIEIVKNDTIDNDDDDTPITSLNIEEE